MKNTAILLVLLMVGGNVKGEINSILEDYQPYIDTTLETVKMDRSDLQMPYDVSSPDAHRLPVINELFDTPLNTMNVVNEEANFLKNHYDDPDTLFSHIAHQLDESYDNIDKPQPQDNGVSRWNEWRLGSRFPHLKNDILKFIETAFVAEQLVDKAFERLSEKEEEKLKNRLPGLYSSLQNEENGASNEGTDLRERRKKQRQSREQAQNLFEITEQIEVAHLLLASELMYDKALSLKETLQDHPLPHESYTFSTDLGKVALGEIPEEAPLLMILGDENHNISFRESPENLPIQTTINTGGDNVYKTDHQGLGSGYMGIGILIDMAGDDAYFSESYSQGSGFLGTGILLDMEGDDYYSSSITSQGSAGFGTGLLIDLDGNDVFKGGQYVQGSGWVEGYGAAISGGGSDRFITSAEFVDAIRYEDRHLSLAQGMGMGHRPYASGGIGLLLNAGGNNLYQTDIYGQGSAYWFSLGGLVDFGGNDEYLSHQYAQGAGVHMAFGALLDKGGDDHFKTHGVSQGCGHDYAFGGFYSAGGDDDVVCAGLSQGAGNANGSALFLNGGGDNAYIARQHNTQGYSDFRRGFGMTGLFLNFSEQSWYGSYHGEPLRRWTSGTYGSGWDIEQKAEPAEEREERNDEERIAENIADNVEELFLQASESLIQYQYLVNPARDSLAQKGEEAIEHIMQHLDSDLPREVHAMRRLVRMFDDKPTPYLQDSLESEREEVASRSLNLMVEMAKDSLGRGALEAVLPFREHHEWSKRVSAYRYLGYYGDPNLTEYIKPGLEDEHYHVRRAAAEAMHRSPSPKNASLMVEHLNDPQQQVRYNAERFFAELGKDGADFLMENVIFKEEIDDKARFHALGALTRLDEIEEEWAEKLLGLLEKNWRYRSKVVEIAALSSEEIKEKVRQALIDEKDPHVTRQLEKLDNGDF